MTPFLYAIVAKSRCVGFFTFHRAFVIPRQKFRQDDPQKLAAVSESKVLTVIIRGHFLKDENHIEYPDTTYRDALVKDIVGESENSSNDFFQGVSSEFA